MIKILLFSHLAITITCLWTWFNIVYRARKLGYDINYKPIRYSLVSLIPIYNLILALGWYVIATSDDLDFDIDMYQIMYREEKGE